MIGSQRFFLEIVEIERFEQVGIDDRSFVIRQVRTLIEVAQSGPQASFGTP